MTIESVQLRKVLCLFGAPAPLRIKKLREDIRAEIKKQKFGPSDGGGDFHVPFWADAKRHARGVLDLSAQTEFRISKHDGRTRLYPELRDGFLKWWKEERRWRNEEFTFIEAPVHGHYHVAGLGEVRVEGPLGIVMSDGSHRIVYPYLSEEPILDEELTRLGLWLLSQALPKFDISEFRILDVMRGKSRGVMDCPLQGNEAETFTAKYKALLAERAELALEYAAKAA